MTWEQFKEFVDKYLAEHNIDPTVVIWYIDISFPVVECITIDVDDTSGLNIA